MLLRLLGLTLAVIAPFLQGPQSTDGLDLTFLGNMAFKITDGNTTLLTDFPYQSGAFGYMEYRMADVGAITNGVALISHEHADHWDPELFGPLDLVLIAHPEIAAGIDPARVLPWSERIVFGDIVVEPVATPHTPAHSSYRVTWHGVRMYFTGDTESIGELLAQTDLDVAFISPWLAERLIASEQRVDADRIVIYHHRDGERSALPQGAMQPQQGDVVRFPFGDEVIPRRMRR